MRIIYFAGSIRGGREDQELYAQLIAELTRFGQVLTEHVGNPNLAVNGEDQLTDRQIWKRDINWLNQSQSVVAEVTTVSLGVGYEIATAELLNKDVLCLYRPQPGRRLSAMIAGSPGLKVVEYTSLDDARQVFEAHFGQ